MALTVGMGRPASPTLERAVECAGLGETEQESDLADGEPAFAQVALCNLAPHASQDLPEARAFVNQPAVQRAGTHVESGCDTLARRFAVGQFVFQESSERTGDGFRARRTRNDDVTRQRIRRLLELDYRVRAEHPAQALK